MVREQIWFTAKSAHIKHAADHQFRDDTKTMVSFPEIYACTDLANESSVKTSILKCLW